MLRLSLFALLFTSFIAPSTFAQPGGIPGGPEPIPPAKMSDADWAAQKPNISYAFGYNLGKNLKKADADLDAASVAKGLAEALAGKESTMKEDEIAKLLGAFEEEMTARAIDHHKKSVQAGIDYLAKNKSVEGVTTTKSGLQHKVMTAGKGESPKATDNVRVHYKGTFVDGEVFDSSYDRGEPFEVNVGGGIIDGWKEALQMMKPGEKAQVVIPSELAYGKRGSYDGSIAPDQTLIFEIELIEVVKK